MKKSAPRSAWSLNLNHFTLVCHERMACEKTFQGKDGATLQNIKFMYNFLHKKGILQQYDLSQQKPIYGVLKMIRSCERKNYTIYIFNVIYCICRRARKQS